MTKKTKLRLYQYNKIYTTSGERIMAARKRKSKNYVNNADLLIQIRLSKDKQEKNPEFTPAECLTNELVKMLMMLVEKYSQRANWRNYTYIDDMRGEAIASLCQNALKFKPEKSINPFGYYTQIVTHSFLTFLEKEKKVRKIRDDILELNGFTPSFTRQLDNDEYARINRENRAATHDEIVENTDTPDEYKDHI